MLSAIVYLFRVKAAMARIKFLTRDAATRNLSLPLQNFAETILRTDPVTVNVHNKRLKLQCRIEMNHV